MALNPAYTCMLFFEPDQSPPGFEQLGVCAIQP